MAEQTIQIFRGYDKKNDYDAVRRAITYYLKSIAAVVALEDDNVPNPIIDVCNNDKRDVNDLGLGLNDVFTRGLSNFELFPEHQATLQRVLEARLSYLEQLATRGPKYATVAQQEAAHISHVLKLLRQPNEDEPCPDSTS